MTGQGVEASVPAAAARYRFRLMGQFAVRRDGERLADREVGSRKGRTMLQALLVHAGEQVPAERLADIVWDGAPPEPVARHLAPLVSRLRRLLGSDAIEGGPHGYRFRPTGDVEIDIVEAQRLATEAEGRLAADAPSLAWVAAERGLSLLGDRDLLEEVTADWVTGARESCRRLRHRLRVDAWEAALALSDGAAARRVAEAAWADEPLDEEACRALMRAHRQCGDVAQALAVYEQLRDRLATELGVDPSPATRDLHLSLLREEPPAPAQLTGTAPGPRLSQQPGFVGREAELAVLERHWSAAVAGQPTLALIVGEAGIGKTRLAEHALLNVRATGGTTVRVRCYEAERSLFLGPVVEALAVLTRELPPEQLRAAADRWAGTLADLVPDIDRVLRPLGYERGMAAVERRRAFEAVTALLHAVSRDRPLLLFLDDLHNAGASTIELLHYVARRGAGSRLLLTATVRVEEGQGILDDLAGVADRLDLGPLSADAVSLLARAAGADPLASRLVELTRGHTLSVVETLHAFAETGGGPDDTPIPASLQEAVLARVRRAGPDVEELLRAAATLGSTFELGLLSQLVEVPLEETARRTQRAATARLLVEDGPRFAFSNDLIREIVERTTPLPVRIARHRRAAVLLEANPEAVALHARAAGDWSRALDAWLEAGSRAMHRYASRDAERLLDEAEAAAVAARDDVGRARVHLARGLVRESLSAYEGAVADFEAAVELARVQGRPDLEAAALRWLGGDALVGLGRPTIDCLPYLEAGLELAEVSGEEILAVELLDRLAVIWSNRARFDVASDYAQRALDRAGSLTDDRAMVFALDAVKTVSAHTGDLDRLTDVIPRLERVQRAAGDLLFLQWTVFESAIPPLAQARWASAGAALDRALAINRRTGHPYNAMFLAQRAWLHRAQGDYGPALEAATEASRRAHANGHPWWVAFTAAIEGWIRSDLGDLDEAVDRLAEGSEVADRDGMEAYLLRCLCHLALAQWLSGHRGEAAQTLERAEGLLAGVTAPAGRAFLYAGPAYAAAARVRLARGQVAAAERLLDVVAGPAERAGWCEITVTDRLLRGVARSLRGDLAEASALVEDAAVQAERAALRPLAWEARATLAGLAARAGDGPAHDACANAAAAHLEVMAASIGDTERRARYLASAPGAGVAALVTAPDPGG